MMNKENKAIFESIMAKEKEEYRKQGWECRASQGGRADIRF